MRSAPQRCRQKSGHKTDEKDEEKRRGSYESFGYQEEVQMTRNKYKTHLETKFPSEFYCGKCYTEIMNVRIILTLIGLATGWFLFEEIIIGAAVFAMLGIIVWFGHKRNKK